MSSTGTEFEDYSVMENMKDLYLEVFQEHFLSCQRNLWTSVIQILWYSPSPANPLCYLRAKINNHQGFITGVMELNKSFSNQHFLCFSLFFLFPQYACDVQAEVVGKPAKRFFESALAELGVPPEQVRLGCHDHGLCLKFLPTGAFFLLCYSFEKLQKRLKGNMTRTQCLAEAKEVPWCLAVCLETAGWWNWSQNVVYFLCCHTDIFPFF